MHKSHSVSLSLARESGLRNMQSYMCKVSPDLYTLVYYKLYQPVLFAVHVAVYLPTKTAISNARRRHE